MSSVPAPGLIDRLRALDPERHARRLAPAGAVLCVLAAAIGHWAAAPLAIVGLVLLLVSCLSRDDGLLVLGPFVGAELARASRRRLPPAFWRAVYAAAVVAMLGLTYVDVTDEYSDWRNPPPLGERMQRVAVTFFLTFSVAQLLYLSYLTVALLAPLVAEEREARRLDFLLATDLRNREILIGKAVGRLPQLLDPILAALPVLALLPFFGGVPPAFVLAAAAATLATVLSLAGVSFYTSTQCPKAGDAMGAAFGLCMTYLMASGILWATRLHQEVWTFPASFGVESPVTLGDFVRAVSIGNPIAVVLDNGDLIGNGADPESTVLNAVRWYSLFHLGVFAACGLLAVARLRNEPRWVSAPRSGTGIDPATCGTGTDSPTPRPIPILPENPPPDPEPGTRDSTPAAGPPGSRPKARTIALLRPPVTDYPVEWLERYRTPQPEVLLDWRTQVEGTAILGALLVIVFNLIPYVIDDVHEYLPSILTGLTTWGVTFSAMGVIAVRAATTVAREREKGTLESLLLTSLGCREILRQKWRGCVFVHAGLFGFLFGVVVAGLFTLRLHPITAAFLLVAVPAYSAFAASLGLVFSVRAKNQVRANAWMGVTTALFLLVTTNVAISVARHGLGLRRQAENAAIAAVVPPGATAMATFIPQDWQRGRGRSADVVVVAGAIGVAAYGGLAWVLWKLAVRRFEREWEGRR